MASIYQRGNNFTLQWTVGGKRHRRSLGKISRQQAITILHAKETELRSGKSMFGGLLEDRRTGLFSDFASEYLSWRRGEYPDSQQRIEQIVHDHLIPVFGNLPLSEITVRMGEKYKHNRQKKVAIQTVNKEVRTLHAVLNKAVEWGEIEKNPIKSVKALKDSKSSPPKFFTAQELKALYSIDPMHAEIWMLLANTGMRRKEALNLKWSEVFDATIRVLSTSQNRTKSGLWRDIPISPGAEIALGLLRDDNAKQSDYVVPRMNKDSLSRAFQKACRKIGIGGSLHDLRHTFCSHLVMQGIPLRTVQVLAGHASFRTTEIYAHLSPGHLSASVERLVL